MVDTRPYGPKGTAMKIARCEIGEFQERDGIAIEKSADQMDEVQYATERDLAIRNVDRESRQDRRSTTLTSKKTALTWLKVAAWVIGILILVIFGPLFG